MYLKSHLWLSGIFALAMSISASGQTEAIFTPVPPVPDGIRFEFSNAPLHGGTFKEFEFNGAVAMGIEGLHELIIVFEWRDEPGGEIFQSPDNAYTITPFETNFIMTGVFTVDHCPPIAAIHFYTGVPMTVTGEFRHDCMPEPGSGLLLAAAAVAIGWRRR